MVSHSPSLVSLIRFSLLLTPSRLPVFPWDCAKVGYNDFHLEPWCRCCFTRSYLPCSSQIVSINICTPNPNANRNRNLTVTLTSQSVSINISTTAKDDIVSLTVRPWFDMVEDIRSQVCSIDTPSQRLQLFLGSKRLQKDGRVLAQHGVVAGSTVHLVSAQSVPR